MSKEEIYSYLCYYDKRNPDSYLNEMTDQEIEHAQKNCSCDNCFYGRTKLANELLNTLILINN